MPLPVPVQQTMKLSEAKKQLADLVGQVSRGEMRVMVEQDGTPVAAIVSIDDLQRLTSMDRERTRRRQVLDAMREPFRGVPFEEIERETAKAIAEVRAEMRAEREAAARKAR